MNFLRKMTNRDYDIKLDMNYEEFGKHPVYTNINARKKPKDVFVIKFNDCTKVYAVSSGYRSCLECPLRIKDIAKEKVCCGLKHKVEYNITVGACTYVGYEKGMSNIKFVDMDTIMEGL